MEPWWKHVWRWVKGVWHARRAWGERWVRRLRKDVLYAMPSTRCIAVKIELFRLLVNQILLGILDLDIG
jgi:hypothetical protein